VKLKNNCPIGVIQNYSKIIISSLTVNYFGLYFTNIILEMHLNLYIEITCNPSGITCTSVFVFGCIIKNYYFIYLHKPYHLFFTKYIC